MPQTPNGVPYPDAYSPYPSRHWWKALADALDPFVGKLSALPDLGGLRELLAKKVDKPASALTGQVLAWNGSEWVAWTVEGSTGTGGGTGTGLPMSTRGSLLVGTGTDWIVLPGGTKAGDSILVDPSNGYGYRWGSPLPAPGQGKLIAATAAGWTEVPVAPKAGMALISDPREPNGVRWGTELPTPSKGSVFVADGTKWLPLPWSGKDGESLLVDTASSAGVKWGGVLPSPLKGALLVGDGVTWRLVTPTAAEAILVSDPSASMGLRWSTDLVKRTDLDAYARKTDMSGYLLKTELAAAVQDAVRNRWKGWTSCPLASGWSGSLYANTDGTQIVLRGQLYPTSTGSGNRMASLPSAYPSVYSEGLTTHIPTLEIDQNPGRVIRPSVVSVSGSSISVGGTVANLSRSYGVKFSSTVVMAV